MGIISTTHHFDSDVEDYPDDDPFADVDDYSGARENRWRSVALVAAGVLALALLATALIVNGGDSTSTSATVGPAPTRSVTAPPRPPHPTALPPRPPLPRETMTTVAPPSALPTTTAAPTAPQTPPWSVPVLDPHTIVYRVTGTKRLLDFVSIVYTDGQGLPHTDFNVSLPWSKTIVMGPGVQLKSVIATSLGGHLDCAITNAQGQLVVASTTNAMLATCTQ